MHFVREVYKMGNPTIPAVKIMLDKERTLLFDLNALVEYEEVTGKSLISGVNLSNLKMKDIRALLYAGLVHEDEKITLKQVGKLLHFGNLEGISALLEIAFAEAMPEKKEDNDPPLT